VQTVQAMKSAGRELTNAMKRDELNISGIERMQDDMADVMVISRSATGFPISSFPFKKHYRNTRHENLLSSFVKYACCDTPPPPYPTLLFSFHPTTSLLHLSSRLFLLILSYTLTLTYPFHFQPFRPSVP
jgi:hypothetical protein